MNILNEIAQYAKTRVAKAKNTISLEDIKAKAFSLKKGDFAFHKALSLKDFAFICECKKASPSKGIIDKEFDYLKIAKEYELAKADAISVLTEPKWFLGDDLFLKQIANSVSIPCIRKDFLIDEYMIYEAKLLNASAVLLICSILDENTIKEYIKICDELGICALVEAHNEDEVKKALKANARIIGVNNRNLKDFSVNTQNSINLRKLVPDDIIFVAESGINSAEDIKILAENKINAVLIGESLMRAENKALKLKELKRFL